MIIFKGKNMIYGNNILWKTIGVSTPPAAGPFGDHPTLGTSLSAYYTLSDLNDSSGNGYTLTNNGGTTNSSTNPKIGTALLTTRTSGGVYTPSAAFNPAYNEAWSLSGWFYPTTTTLDHSIWGNLSGGKGFYMYGDGDIATNGYMEYHFNSSAGSISGTVNGQFVLSQTNTWNHIVVTYDGSGTAAGLKIYRNGSELTKTNTVDTLGTGDTQSGVGLAIGQYTAADSSVCLAGTTDEVGIWSKVLTTAEISALYRGGSGITYA